MVESTRQFKTREAYLSHCAAEVERHRAEHKPWTVLVRKPAPPPYEAKIKGGDVVDVIPRGEPHGAVIAWYAMGKPIGLPNAAERKMLFIGASAVSAGDRFRFDRGEAVYRSIREAKTPPINFHAAESQELWGSFYRSFPRSCRDMVQQMLRAIQLRESAAPTDKQSENPPPLFVRRPLHDLYVQWSRVRAARRDGQEAVLLSALSRIVELPINNLGNRELWPYLESHAAQARRMLAKLVTQPE